jgi:membrane-anchored mycosin MYCP
VRTGRVVAALVVAWTLCAIPGVRVTPEQLSPAAVPPPGSRPDGCSRAAPAYAAPPGTDRVGRAAAERLRLTTLHALATGRGERVAVIDTGVAPHPRLAGRLVGVGDYLGGGDGLDDCDGHGTAVAGLIAAAADPGDDLVGVAPAAQILAVRQFSPSLAGRPGHLAGDLPSLADALVRSVRRGADVVNVSGAVCVPAAQVDVVGAPVRAALDLARRADVVVVAAAGNLDGGGCAADAPGQVSLPGFFGDDLLTVGAVGPDDRPAPFTVRGPWVDVAAPGTGVGSLSVDGGTGAPLDGTSFAAPYVAGLAALIRERHPDLSARQVADRITATARRPASGRDDAVGFGVVDPVAALTAEPAVLRPGPTAPPHTVVLSSGEAPPPGPRRWPFGALALLALTAGAALTTARPRGRARR